MKDNMENRSEMKTAKRALSKVFVSSVCTILICVACLTGTAWAWYSAYIENTGSVIHIGDADVTVTIDGTEVSSGVEVSPEENEGSHMIVTHGGSEDAFRKRSTVYMTISANGQSCGYVELTQKAVIILHPEIECELKWETSWVEPQDEQPLADLAGTIRFEIVEAEETTAPTETAPSEPATEPSEPAATTEPTTAPSEPDPTTQPTTAPSEPDPTTQPTTAPSEPDPTTAPTTAPSEPDPTTQPTTAPSEPDPTTQPETPATEGPTAPPKQDPPATEAPAATEATGGEEETT